MTDDELDRLRNNILSALIILRDQTDQLLWLDKRVLAIKMSHSGSMSDLIAAVGSLARLDYVEIDRDLKPSEALEDFSNIRLTNAGQAFYDHGNRFVQPAETLESRPLENAILTEAGDFLVTEDGDYLTTETSSEENVTGSPIRIDSASWTGLSRVRVTPRNAKAISGLINIALQELGTDSNEKVAQARTLLLAARDLTDAPDPPSDIIWDLIQRAGAIVGLLDIFFKIFSAVVN